MNKLTSSLASAGILPESTNGTDYSRTPNKYVTVNGTKLAYKTLGSDPTLLRWSSSDTSPERRMTGIKA